MTLQVIVGGQYGSEGKGAIAAHLAQTLPDLLAVRVAGPNAGHTVIGRCPPSCPERSTADGIGAHHPDAHPWRLRQVPVAAVTNESAVLALGPGSEIDPDVLIEEVTSLNAAGYRVGHRLWIDHTATVITAENKIAESDDARTGHDLVARIGSTGKGIGAARAARIMREALTADQVDGWPCNLGDISEHIRHRLTFGNAVQIEGTQGYGLGLHAGFYPYCTSSDCTAMDFMAMAGCPPWLVPDDQIEIWVVYRTFPIRVAGASGPLTHETTWEAIGQPTEYTTVTRKPRRVGKWDPILARRALEANGHRSGPGSRVFAALTMADYVVPGIAGCDKPAQFPDPSVNDQFEQMVARYSKDIGTLVRLVGTGPSSVIDLRGNPASIGRKQMEKEYIA